MGDSTSTLMPEGAEQPRNSRPPPGTAQLWLTSDVGRWPMGKVSRCGEYPEEFKRVEIAVARTSGLSQDQMRLRLRDLVLLVSDGSSRSRSTMV